MFKLYFQVVAFLLIENETVRDLFTGPGWLMAQTLVVDHIWFPEFGYRFIQELLDCITGAMAFAALGTTPVITYKLFRLLPTLEEITSLLIRTILI